MRHKEFPSRINIYRYSKPLKVQRFKSLTAFAYRHYLGCNAKFIHGLYLNSTCAEQPKIYMGRERIEKPIKITMHFLCKKISMQCIMQNNPVGGTAYRLRISCGVLMCFFCDLWLCIYHFFVSEKSWMDNYVLSI